MRSNESAELAIDLIDRPNDPLRDSLESEAIDELAHSMSVHGLLHPIRVRDKGSRFEVITGDRRLEAARRLHWPTITGIVTDAPEDTLLEMRLHENLHRVDLKPSEEARRVSFLATDQQWPLHRIAAAMGKSIAWIEDRLSMSEWPSGLTELVDHKRITLGVARVLNQIEDDTALQYLAGQAAETGATIAQARAWLQSYRSKPWKLPSREEIEEAKRAYVPPPAPQVFCSGCDALETINMMSQAMLCPACLVMLKRLRRENP